LNPSYPIYIVSKGRSESRLTAKALERMVIPYRIVVEPQEYAQYARVIDPAKILKLPFSNLGFGSIPARNWIWRHAVDSGAAKHWVLDDNISGFWRLNRNAKIPVRTGAFFRAMEDFVDRYENVALAGPQYFMFASARVKHPPFILNTRIYSCILVKNDLRFRWRGRYNEDTDLSIRVLKDGWATILFNAFLACKIPTMRMKGGNAELYAGDGRLRMAQSLRDQHPDVVRITRKWNRWQHAVDYRRFKGNRLIPKPGVAIPEGTNDVGMRLKKRIQSRSGSPRRSASPSGTR
jgi:TET-associated glycosyltransferase-like protein